MIYVEILKQLTLDKYKKYAIYQHIYRFLKRNNFSFRCGTYIGQMIPDNSITLINNFLDNIKKIKCII